MAYAAAPHYEDLIDSRAANASEEKKIGIAIGIGEAMESARRDYLGATAGSRALKEVVVAEPTPVTPAREFAAAALRASEETPPRGIRQQPQSAEQSPPSPLEVEQQNFNHNVQAMLEATSSIFTSAQNVPDLVNKAESQLPTAKYKYGAISEELILYHPDSGAVTFLDQDVTYGADEGRKVIKAQLRDISPLNNITQPVEAKKPNRFGDSQTAIKNPSRFNKDQPMAQDDSLVIVPTGPEANATIAVDAAGNRNLLDSKQLSAWITRLNQSVPLTKEEFSKQFRTFDPGQGGTRQVATAGPKGEVMRTVVYQRLAPDRKTDKMIANAAKRYQAVV
jgi:hypothetical protein